MLAWLFVLNFLHFFLIGMGCLSVCLSLVSFPLLLCPLKFCQLNSKNVSIFFFCSCCLSLDEGCDERLGKFSIFQVLLGKLRRNIGHHKHQQLLPQSEVAFYIDVSFSCSSCIW